MKGRCKQIVPERVRHAASIGQALGQSAGPPGRCGQAMRPGRGSGSNDPQIKTSPEFGYENVSWSETQRSPKQDPERIRGISELIQNCPETPVGQLLELSRHWAAPGTLQAHAEHSLPKHLKE